MEEVYKFYVGEIGLSPDEFYDSTPAELELKAMGYFEAKKNNLRLQSYAMTAGVINALSKKKVELFKENEVKTITREDKMKELTYLKNEFQEEQ